MTDPFTPTLTLAEAYTLVSWWKPLVLLLPLIPWAWLVSAVFDKHCARFFLPRETWNLVHLSVGLVAFLAALLIPVRGELGVWIGLLVILALLGADIGIFMAVANKDERVAPEHHLRLDLSRLGKARDAKAAARKAGKAELIVKQPGKVLLPVPDSESPEFQVRVAAEAMVIRALDSRATQVELAPTGAKDGTHGVVMLIDGVRQAGETMPAANAAKVIDFWKTAAKLDVAERRKKLQDDSTIERGGKTIKARITSIGSQAGQRITLLFNPENQVKRKPEDLGLLPPQFEELKLITAENKGVVILAGQPDGGRTTLMYSVLKMHDAYTNNVQTVEFEIQDALEGIRQNKFDPQTEGPDHSTLVRSILRRDPDVVALAELPDQATAKEVARADQERSRTYVSVKADNALAAVQLWMKTHGEPEPASKCLKGVVAGKLVRKLCTNCRVPYTPAPDMLKKLGLPADKVKQLFKKGGQVIIKKDPETCPVCQGNGYVGQEGAFEVYAFGDAERELIKALNFKGLAAELRKKQLPNIQQVALRKAVDGLTSVEEVLRVTAEPPPGGGQQPAGASKPPAPQPPKPPAPAPAGT